MSNPVQSILALLFVLLATQAGARQPVSWEALTAELSALDVTAPQIDFAMMLRQDVNSADWQQQQQMLKHNQYLLQKHSPENSCQSMVMAMLDTVIETELLGLKLGEEQAIKQQQYHGSIAALDNGQAWYRYLGMLWLGEDVAPEQLYQIGQDHFNQAINQLRFVQQQIQKNQLLTKFIASDDDSAIQKHYLETEHKVKQHLIRQFLPEGGVAALNIARSLQGADFPAPGYYDRSNHTMYYHPLNDRYDMSQMQWLYLHEGVPGHHYQSQVSTQSTFCREDKLDAILSQGRMAFVEGWAAYVETLGIELGMYKEPQSHLYALKWEALRAMRVMIDVGLHAKGWTDAKAQQYWLRLFPEGEDVMMREINRIKRWPMQVNTYVYGKHQIEQLKQRLKTAESDAFDVRKFHQNLLKISYLPIHVLNQYEQLFTTREQSS